MKLTFKLMYSVVVFGFLVQPLSADFFENLDFEDAEIVLDRNGNVIQSLALPFWETNAEFFLYNQFCLGSRCTTIFDDGNGFFDPLQGVYSLSLDAGTEGGECFLTQTGTVPDSATCLTLLVDPISDFDPNDFQVAFDATPLVLKSQGDRWAYDVSPFSGATGELKITTFSNNVDVGFVIIDDIKFIPEPSSFLWSAAIGLIVLGTERRAWRSRRI